MTEVIDGMSNAAYHAHPALGSSSLKTLATKTPAHFKHDQANPRHSDAFSLGTAAHSLILESDETAFSIIDAPNWLTKDAKAAKAEALASNRVPLLTKDYQQVQAMRDAAMSHPLAKVAFTDHVAERSIFWNEDGLDLKVRPDALHVDKGLICDLKTAQSADPRKFGKTAADFGYAQQAAHYIDGVTEAYGETPAFLFVLIEKQEPWLVSVVELDPQAIDIGRRLNARAKAIYRDCVKRNEWPGYISPGPISLPVYAERQLEGLLDE